MAWGACCTAAPKDPSCIAEAHPAGGHGLDEGPRVLVLHLANDLLQRLLPAQIPARSAQHDDDMVHCASPHKSAAGHVSTLDQQARLTCPCQRPCTRPEAATQTAQSLLAACSLRHQELSDRAPRSGRLSFLHQLPAPRVLSAPSSKPSCSSPLARTSKASPAAPEDSTCTDSLSDNRGAACWREPRVSSLAGSGASVDHAGCCGQHACLLPTYRAGKQLCSHRRPSELSQQVSSRSTLGPIVGNVSRSVTQLCWHLQGDGGGSLRMEALPNFLCCQMLALLACQGAGVGRKHHAAQAHHAQACVQPVCGLFCTRQSRLQLVHALSKAASYCSAVCGSYLRVGGSMWPADRGTSMLGCAMVWVMAASVQPVTDTMSPARAAGVLSGMQGVALPQQAGHAR